MPFLLYEKYGEDGGLDLLARNRTFTFGGHKNGALPQYLDSKGILEKAKGRAANHKGAYLESFGVDSLLDNAGKDPDTHRLVIDLKPYVKGNVSLYEVRELWVVIYEAWTPVMLRLHSLFVDHHVTKGREDECKSRLFIDPNRDAGCPIHDIIYLNGGYGEKGAGAKGWWNPSRLGQYSAVLLWPDAAAYFSQNMLGNVSKYQDNPAPLRNRLGCER